MEFELKKRYNAKDLKQFADIMRGLSRKIGFKVSSRGWGYILEGERLINKDQFDKVATLINDCRKAGYLPIDFVAEEAARQFSGVEVPDKKSVVHQFASYLGGALAADEHTIPDWWRNEKYYIQMVVEKIDLVTLFEPVCEEYKIPIANSKGWSSILQRAEYARRYAEAERRGMKCVLLYCGDHDPDGLRIAEFIYKNLEDVKDVRWSDGVGGFDPSNLIIERFGLTYEFIEENDLTWIDNLITGSGLDLADPTHKNHNMPYLQDYLSEIGERKCEANAVVTMPDAARELCKEAIEKYLGEDAVDRFEAKRQAVRDQFEEYLERTGNGDVVRNIINDIRSNEE
jgi:hypothetical protein